MANKGGTLANLGQALSGYGSALSGNPLYLQNSLLLRQAQQQQAERERQQRQDQTGNAAALSYLRSGMMEGTPATKQMTMQGPAGEFYPAFAGGNRTIGQNREATPVSTDPLRSLALFANGSTPLQSIAAKRAIDQLYPQGFTGTVGQDEIAYQNGKVVAEGPKSAPKVDKLPAEAELAKWLFGGNEAAAREYLKNKDAPKQETRDQFEVLTPEAARALNLPEGGSYKRNMTTGDVVAIAQPRQENARFNNDQNKAAGYANTMATAEKRIEDLIGTVDATGKRKRPKYDPTGIISGWSLSNATASSEAQQYRQAKKEWGLAVLRHESGANVPDSEAEAYAETFFPTVGDTKATIEAKAQARKNKIAGIMAASGGAYESAFGQPKGGGASGSWSIVRED